MRVAILSSTKHEEAYGVECLRIIIGGVAFVLTKLPKNNDFDIRLRICREDGKNVIDRVSSLVIHPNHDPNGKGPYHA